VLVKVKSGNSIVPRPRNLSYYDTLSLHPSPALDFAVCTQRAPQMIAPFWRHITVCARGCWRERQDCRRTVINLDYLASPFLYPQMMIKLTDAMTL
jgi:hypothetical protein